MPDYRFTEKRFTLYNGKYELIEQPEERIINQERYENITGKEILKFFRNLGGTETLVHNGKRHTLTSYSPSRDEKVIRTFIEV